MECVYLNPVGGGRLRIRNCPMGSTQGGTKPNYLSDQAQPSQDNRSKKPRKTTNSRNGYFSGDE